MIDVEQKLVLGLFLSQEDLQFFNHFLKEKKMMIAAKSEIVSHITKQTLYFGGDICNMSSYRIKCNPENSNVIPRSQMSHYSSMSICYLLSHFFFMYLIDVYKMRLFNSTGFLICGGPNGNA